MASLGYGTDLVCGWDLDPTMAETDPNSVSGIGQAVFRRWDCPRGALPPDSGRDSRDYGVDIRGMLNRGTTDAVLNAAAASLAQEALKDDRIAAIKVGVRPSGTAALPILTITAMITPADPALGSFSLVLEATSADVVLKAIGGAA